MDTEIVTDRLTLRRARPGDAAALHALASDFDVVKMTASWPWPPDRAFTKSRAAPFDPALGMAGVVLLGGQLIGMMGALTAEPGPGTGEPEKVQPKVLTPFDKECAEKRCVTLTGTIKVQGEAKAGVDLDCFVPDSSTPAGRKLVNKVKLAGPGAYTMKVPAKLGQLSLVAFMDLENDGPDRSDPQGGYSGNPIEIKDKDLENIDIELTSPESATQ